MYVALQRVARRAVPGRPEADDLISLAFLRLLTKGPRTRAADAQAADAALAAARRGVQALVRDLPASVTAGAAAAWEPAAQLHERWQQ